MITTALLCGCQSSKMEISGRFVGNDAQKVYLEQVTSLTQVIVDSTTLDKNGNYEFKVKDATKLPSLYNLIYNGDRIPMLLAGGDCVNLSAVGNTVRNYTVEGSEETELLRQFYQGFVAGAQALEHIAAQFGQGELTSQKRKALIKEYTDEYYRVRRQQLQFIITHKSSLASVYALYQRLPGDSYLFNGDSDVVYFRTVAEALAESYPESPYLQSLQSDIARMDARINLTSQITEAQFPDLDMPDMYGKSIKLSSLKGKVVLVDFWSAELGNSNVLNAELKEVYAKYHHSNTGFEVYQVAVDSSKALWITAVQEQELPWISVSDLKGRMSPSIGMYNIQKLPANFLIDKQGNIVARDLYGKTLDARLAELTR